MIILSNALVVLLAQPAPAATCDFEDNHCKAARHERRAAAASKPDDRAYYLHLAHRSYLFAFDKSGDPVELCAARRAFDASLAIEGQSDKQRESTLATRADLTAREGKAQTRCANQKNTHERRTQKQRPRRLVADGGAWQAPRASGLSPASPSVTLSAMTSSHGTVQAAPTGDAAPPSSADLTPADPSILLPVGGRARARPPKFPQPEEAPVEVRRARPGRSLVIGGGVTLGAGLALAGVAGYLGGRTLDVRRQTAALEGLVDGFADDKQLTQDQQLTRDYERMGTQTLVLALTGGTTIVVAAVLLGVGGRRMARVASRTSLVPAPGGLFFGLDFEPIPQRLAHVPEFSPLFRRPARVLARLPGTVGPTRWLRRVRRVRHLDVGELRRGPADHGRGSAHRHQRRRREHQLIRGEPPQRGQR